MFDFWPVYSGERFRASWPSCYPFVLLLILLLKGFKNFLMLLPSTNDKNDSLTNGMQTFFLFYNQTIAKLMFIMHKRVL